MSAAGNRARRELEALLRLRHQDWRDEAACLGAPAAGVEFVDPAPADVPDLLRTYCFRCPVVGLCREEGDAVAPHRYAVVYGGRYYAAGEPLEGWQVGA